MSDIKNFTFAPGLELRVIDRNGEPWFVAADVCKALGISNPTQAVRQHVDTDDWAILKIEEMGRSPNCVNESGLYSLILKSRKPEARAFKKWVTSEVLPTIRKTGGYMAPSVATLAETDPEQFLARAVLIAQRLRL